MPYGDLTKQAVQRFERYEDLDAADATIEEREEYEPHIAEGNIVFAGVDYAAILERAEQEADVIVWDGGNNDTPFIHPDLHIVVVDPHRPGHELRYHPGEHEPAHGRRLRREQDRHRAAGGRRGGARLDPRGESRSDRSCARPRPSMVEQDTHEIAGKRVLAIEDGPTLTHGEMTYGAAVLAAKQGGAAELVDPRPSRSGSIKETFAKYPHMTELLPAMGYGRKQMEELRETIERSDADLVLIGTPIDLRRVIELDKPALRVTYRPAGARRADARRAPRRARHHRAARTLAPAVLKTPSIALGGNALMQPGERGTAAEQRANLATTFRAIRPLLRRRALRDHARERPAGRKRASPPGACERRGSAPPALRRRRADAGRDRRARRRRARAGCGPAAWPCVMTRVEVDEDDPAFENPTKPVGPFYDAERARELEQERGWAVKEDAGRGWRRVVPSPRPSRCSSSTRSGLCSSAA